MLDSLPNQPLERTGGTQSGDGRQSVAAGRSAAGRYP